MQIGRQSDEFLPSITTGSVFWLTFDLAGSRICQLLAELNRDHQVTGGRVIRLIGRESVAANDVSDSRKEVFAKFDIEQILPNRCFRLHLVANFPIRRGNTDRITKLKVPDALEGTDGIPAIRRRVGE